eukprot:s3026_g7.t1
MEGLLKLRVSPSDESVARSVSTIAQKCDASEFDHLGEKMEELTQQRLVQSSDLVIACKDANLEKVERLLRECRLANQNRMGGPEFTGQQRSSSRRPCSPPRRQNGLQSRQDHHPSKGLGVPRRSGRHDDAERRDAHGPGDGAAELGPKSARGHRGAAEARCRADGSTVRNWLPPWTAEEIQRAEPKELVRHFVSTWLPFCRDLMNVDHSLTLKESLLELLLFRGYEATTQSDAPEEMKAEVAQYMASMLERCGHRWESNAVQAECRTKDLVLSKTLADASKNICSVSFSAQFLAVGGTDKKVWIYDLDQEFTLAKTLEDACESIYCTAWSQNLLLAAGGEDKIVRIYDSGQEFTLLKTMGDATEAIHSLSWCGQFLAAGSADRKVRVYDAAQDFILVRALDEASHWILSTSWSGQLLAAAGGDKKIRIYDSSEEFVLLTTLEDATGLVRSLAWGDKMLAAAGEDKQIRIYKSDQDFVLRKTLQDASACIYSLFWSGQLLAAAGDDRKVWVYNSAQDFAVVKTLEDASGGIKSIFWSSGFLAVGGLDKKIWIYNQAQEQKGSDAQLADFFTTFINLAVGSRAEGGIDALVHAAIASRALAVEQDRDVAAQQKSLQSAALVVAQKLRALGWPKTAEEILRSYAVEDFGAIKTFDHTSRTIRSMSWNDQLLATEGEDNKIRIYNSTQEFTLVRTLDDASDKVTSVCWNQQLLAAAGSDIKVRIYSSEQDFSLLNTIADASNCILSLAWNQQLLAAAGKDRKIRVYDSSKDFALLKTLSDASDWIQSLAWGQQLLAAAGDDKTIRIYDATKDFAMLKTIADASDYILSLAWGEQLLAAAGKDRTIRVYDSSKDFAVVKTIADASAAVNCLAWDQQLLAAGGDDKTIRIYDSSAQEWACIKIAMVPSTVQSLGWCGQYLGVGLHNGQLRVLDSQAQCCGALEEAPLKLQTVVAEALQKANLEECPIGATRVLDSKGTCGLAVVDIFLGSSSAWISA